MGISIHYSGSFNKEAVLADLITEVKEVAETFKWEYHIYLEDFPLKKNVSESYDGKIYGISFTPPECETVSICFLSNYRMSSQMHYMLYGHSEIQSEKDYLYMLFVKTQFAGTDIHKTIIELFRYLNKRNYFSEFNLIDEGEFWETGDEKLLEQKFKINGDLIDNFALAIKATSMKQQESYESYFERIMKMIINKGKMT